MTLRATLLALVLLALSAAPAAAGTVSLATEAIAPNKYEPGFIYEVATYVAGPGEANDLRATLEAGVLTVTDGAGVVAGAGCEPASATEARCPIPHGFGSLVIALGDGDDRFASLLSSRVDGGPGDDTLQGTTLDGGPGDDVLRGNEVEGGPGADAITARTVRYAGATAGVRVDLRDLSAAGQAEEGDRIDPRVENVVGGRFADLLVGDERANRLTGGAGDDRIDGGGGDDELDGASGADRLLGGAGDDSLAGGPGADRLDGGPGDDFVRGDGGANVVLGGPGRDTAFGGAGPDRVDGGPGPDRLDGGGGRDRLFSRDGELDLVVCTSYRFVDRASIARADTGDLVRLCGTVRRPRPTRPQIVSVTQGFERHRAVRVDVGCSQDQPGGCRFAMRVIVAGRVVARRVVRVVPGQGQESELSVPGAPYRAAVRGCGRLAATALVTTRDAAGRPFVVRRAVSLRSATAACGPFDPARGVRLTTAAW